MERGAIAASARVTTYPETTNWMYYALLIEVQPLISPKSALPFYGKGPNYLVQGTAQAVP